MKPGFLLKNSNLFISTALVLMLQKLKSMVMDAVIYYSIIKTSKVIIDKNMIFNRMKKLFCLLPPGNKMIKNAMKSRLD